MHGIVAASLLLIAPAAHADDAPDISAALADAKNPKWDPKGKALDPFARAKTKYRNKEYVESIPGFVEATSKRAGCGECLDYLSSALYYADFYAEAIQVGAHLEKLYADREEGPDIIARSYAKMDKYPEANEALERILELEDKSGHTNTWWSRNNNLIAMGALDEATEVLDGAKAAKVADADADCLRVQVLAVKKEPAAARELWDSCGKSKVLDLKRSAEGWLALAEGDTELAGKRLMLSGNEDYARLAIAFSRLESEQYQPAHNLAKKYLEEKDLVDGHLAYALALHGLGKDDEALKALDAKLTAKGWKKAHPEWDLQGVQLKPEGSDWPQVVGRRALALKITILTAQGDTEGAKQLYDAAVEVHGESDDLKAALEPVAVDAEDGGAEGEAEAEGKDKGDGKGKGKPEK